MRKNILIFGHSYATQFIDINNQYTQLFDPKKYEVTVAYLVGEADSHIQQKHLADHVIFLNPPKSSVRGLKIGIIKEITKLCRKKQFQIVICHRYKPTFIMLYVAQFCKIPALFFIMHELGTLSHFFRKFSIATLVRNNMIFAGVSDAVRNDMRQDLRRFPHDRVITLHNMIDIPFTETHLLERTIARKELNLPDGAFVFGNLGRLVKNKDQKTLIHAFATIKPHCPLAKLIIIGDGHLEHELKAQVESLGLTNDVIFTGFLPDGFRFMKAFDVLISASIQEAFGRVLLEAMVATIPIIATRVNGVPEVIGDSGPLIPASDIDILAKEMLNAYQLTPEQRHTWGNRGRERAVQHFSLQRFNEIFWQLPIIKEKDLA